MLSPTRSQASAIGRVSTIEKSTVFIFFSADLDSAVDDRGDDVIRQRAGRAVWCSEPVLAR